MILFALVLAVGIFGLAALLGDDDDAPGIRYVALGDSYTIGQAVGDPADRWPDQLVRHLRAEGVQVELVANTAVSGSTAVDVLERQVPQLAEARPDFASVLVGANDWLQGRTVGEFRRELAALLDAIGDALPDEGQILVVTCPDFALTPTGGFYTQGRDGTAGVKRFNRVIREEAGRRGIPVADVFPASRRVRSEPDLLAGDGLHPSAKQYEAWERAIYPVAREMLE